MRVFCFSTTLALTLLLAACSEAPVGASPPFAKTPAAPALDTSAAASEASPAGDYAMSGARVGTLELREADDGEWTIRLQGGGAPADGAGIAADCEVHARGSRLGDRIDAAVVPFDSALMSVTAADLERQPARMRVVLEADAAVVETDFALCAMHADLDGRYTR